jgi:peroxiredoxin
MLKVAIKEREEDLRKYVNEFKVSSPILLDEKAEVANAYGIQSHPQTFFINREGKVVGRALKGMDWTSKSMRNLIRHLLGEKR